MNKENYEVTTNQFTPEQLAEALPDYADGYWEVNYYDETGYSYLDFYDYVNQTQVDEPYRFGSYQIYKAESDNVYDFQINMLVNATSQ